MGTSGRRGAGCAVAAAALNVLLMAASAGAASAADPIEDFYKGRRMEMVIHVQPGGSYDLYARLVARHLPKHIPGTPIITPQNMPGGGGLRAIGHVGNAPQDGTTLTIVSLGLPMYQALGILRDQLRVDVRDLGWLGNLSDSNPVLTTFHTSKVKTLADARREVAVLGTSGAGSIAAQMPAIYNNMLGTKFKVLFGYGGEADTTIAIERGELDGRPTNTWASYKATLPQWVNEKKLNYIIQVGLKKEPELPDVPLLLDLATDDESRQVYTFLSNVVGIARPLAVSPGTPPERLAALRRAFDAMVKDPAFLGEAEKLAAEVGPMSSERVEAIVNGIMSTPEPLLNKVRQAMELRKEDQGEKPGQK